MSRVVGWVRSLLAPLTRTRAFRWLGPRALPMAERLTRRLTGGRVQVSGLLVPSLTLHTVGAKSGEPRASELMYTPDGAGSAIVAGTNFARGSHPGWTHNLLAHPDAEITVRGRRYAVQATRIDTDPDAREAAWLRIERQWPGYRAYERDAGRQVRLFRLRLVRELQAGRLAARAR
ncbi:nitroreductase family deazaflavin-dependent oxidoreductase [Microbacterium sp. NPDC096154]|uniref:nitroreductase family deazaflavin-dependent oxidoreductase n=1 Tax=Microbacterium sp. NPDC096154 TaxID=3155549 RepID=UPI00332D123A